MTSVESGKRQATRAIALSLAASALLACLSGCTAMNDTVKFAKDAFDPGVPGAKPVTAAEAAQLDEQQLMQRLDFVTQRLDDNRTHAAWWYYGFLTVNVGGMAAGAATAAVTTDSNDQTYNILNASLGLFGTGYLLAAPLPGRSGSDPVYEMPFATHDDRAAQLAAAEEILYGAAGRARQRTGWLLHVGNIVVNGAAASVLLAKESYDNAAMLFFINSAVGEAQILLTPWEPRTSWEDYQQFVARGGLPAEPRARWGVGPMNEGRGLALRVDF